MASTAISEQGGFLSKAAHLPGDIKDYIGELRTEMRRVTWPSWPEVRATTLVVIACVFMFAAFFALMDALMHSTITKVFQAFTK